jgi:beta-galactosidase GanA
MRAIREAGLNAIDTYVFWNEHEQERGQYDFVSAGRDLRLFLQLAHEQGLYVVLRIGPYVCAEWNYGGFPYWLREVPGIDFRTWNAPFMQEMSRFVEHTVGHVKDLFYQNGGPIILLQIENEYGLVEKEYGEEGHRYIEWAAEFAQR